MRFLSETAKLLQPELAASKDAARPVLQWVYLDAEKSEVRVTDSYRAVRYPVELDPGDTSGPIPVEALKASRKPPLKSLSTSIRCNGNVEVRHGFGADASEPYLTIPRDQTPGTFPNIDQLEWDNSGGTEFALNAKLLYDLARAMGSETVRIRLHADSPQLKPFAVTPMETRGGTEATDPKAIMMPIRIGC